MSKEELYDLFIEETGDKETGEVDNNYFKIWLDEYIQTHKENIANKKQIL